VTIKTCGEQEMKFQFIFPEQAQKEHKLRFKISDATENQKHIIRSQKSIRQIRWNVDVEIEESESETK